MTVLDYFVLLIVVASVASGATKGIIRVVTSVAFTVAGLVLAAYTYKVAASVVRIFVAARLADLLGFVLVFLIVLVAGSLLGRWLRQGLKRGRLGWVDHLLGAAFPGKPEAVEQATFGPALLEGTRVVAYLTSRELRERFLNGYETVKQLWGQKR